MNLRTITEAEWIELVTSNDRRAAEIMALNQKLASARTAAEQAQRDAVSKAQLNLAVNRSCSCGGRPPGTPSTCPACEVWHRLFGDLVPPKPVPLPAAQSLPSAIRGEGETEGDPSRSAAAPAADKREGERP